MSTFTAPSTAAPQQTGLLTSLAHIPSMLGHGVSFFVSNYLGHVLYALSMVLVLAFLLVVIVMPFLDPGKTAATFIFTLVGSGLLLFWLYEISRSRAPRLLPGQN